MLCVCKQHMYVALCTVQIHVSVADSTYTALQSAICMYAHNIHGCIMQDMIC